MPGSMEKREGGRVDVIYRPGGSYASSDVSTIRISPLLENLSKFQNIRSNIWWVRLQNGVHIFTTTPPYSSVSSEMLSAWLSVSCQPRSERTECNPWWLLGSENTCLLNRTCVRRWTIIGEDSQINTLRLEIQVWIFLQLAGFSRSLLDWSGHLSVRESWENRSSSNLMSERMRNVVLLIFPSWRSFRPDCFVARLMYFLQFCNLQFVQIQRV